jgi:hypothetical protein
MSADRQPNTIRCPFCEQWIEQPLRFARRAFDEHKRTCAANPAAVAKARPLRERLEGDNPSAPCGTAHHPREATVQRADLFGNIIDTHQTESELNGWKPKQGVLL